MWIKLDFTPLFVQVLIAGLIFVAIGLAIRSNFPNRSAIGIVVIAIGAIAALLCAVALAWDSGAKWKEARRTRRSIEQLAEERAIQGLRFPRGTTIEWSGKLMSSVILPQTMPVLGIPFEGNLKFSNTLTNGNRLAATDVATGTLAIDRSIDGVPCKAHKEVEFFRAGGIAPENGGTPMARLGKLRRCTPSVEFQFAGNRYLAGAEVTLNAYDGVALGVLAVDQDVDGHWCKHGTEVERPNQRAVRFTLARDETIGGIACKAGHEVVIEPAQGRVTSAVLAHDQQIGDIPCRGGENVAFEYGGGSYPLDRCVISRPVTLLNVAWPAGSRMEGLSMTWLGVTLPGTSASLEVGELTLAGPCKVNFDKEPPLLNSATALDPATAYVQFRGARFTELNIYQDNGWGHLAQAATFEGTPYDAGALVRFSIKQAAGEK